MNRSLRFARFAWGVLAYNLAVILWGAYVRASGSGAGCGSHWPLCNGEVLPRAPALETLVELTHRLTSGVALLAVVALAVWAFRLFPRRHPVRRAAALTLVFMLSEAAVGAGLVLFELVAENASMARAMFISVHLANTFFLLAYLALTAHRAGAGGEGSAGEGRARSERPGGLRAASPVLALGGLLLVGVSGAVSALGDTLFPAASLAEALRHDLSTTAHLFVRLRVLHPLIAVAVGLYLLFWGRSQQALRPPGAELRLANLLTLLVFVQLGLGTLNVALLAPIWLQLLHLLLADLVWIVVVLLAAERRSPSAAGLRRAA